MGGRYQTRNCCTRCFFRSALVVQVTLSAWHRSNRKHSGHPSWSLQQRPLVLVILRPLRKPTVIRSRLLMAIFSESHGAESRWSDPSAVPDIDFIGREDRRFEVGCTVLECRLAGRSDCGMVQFSLWDSWTKYWRTLCWWFLCTHTGRYLAHVAMFIAQCSGVNIDNKVVYLHNGKC